MFDTHNHLLSEKFEKDLPSVLQRIEQAGMFSLSCATNYQESVDLINFLNQQKQNKKLFAAIGLDPQDVGREKFDYEKFKKLFEQNNPQIVAVGEIGLDYYWQENLQYKDLQKEVLRQQFELANTFQLPVIIHCRDQEYNKNGAFNDLFQLIQGSDLKYSGVVHSFTGSVEQAQVLIELGFYLGFNGIITFKNAGHLIDVVKMIPRDRILIETDAPYLAPVPYRGSRNEPVYVEYVAQKIADILKMPCRELIEQTTQNAIKLFQIK